MKTTAIALALAGAAALLFAAWGIHTPAGRSNFDEMDGIYPYLAGMAGLVAWAVAIALAVIARKRKSRPSAPPDPTRYRVGQPVFTRYSHFILIAVPVLLFGLFEVFCTVTLNVDADEVIAYWWEHGANQWVMLPALLLLMFLSALLALSFLKLLYAVYFGVERKFVLLGKDLHNDLFCHDLADPAKTVLTVPGPMHQQSRWFNDRFSDLQIDTVVQFGHRPQDVLHSESFATPAAAFAIIWQGLILLVMVLMSFSMVGTYLQGTNLAPQPSADGPAFITTLSWLWQEHGALVRMGLAAMVGLSILMLALTFRNKRFAADKFQHKRLEKLPMAIAPGSTISGTIVDHAIVKSRSSGTGRGRSSTHYTLLVQFIDVFSVPTWLRLSLTDDARNQQWMKRLDGSGPIQQKMRIQTDLSIWPEDLEPDDTI